MQSFVFFGGILMLVLVAMAGLALGLLVQDKSLSHSCGRASCCKSSGPVPTDLQVCTISHQGQREDEPCYTFRQSDTLT